MRSDMTRSCCPGTSLPPPGAHDYAQVWLGSLGLRDDADALEGDLAIELQNTRQRRPESFEKLADGLELRLPFGEVDVGRLVDSRRGDVQTGQVEITGLGHPAKRGLLPADAEPRSVDDPLENP